MAEFRDFPMDVGQYDSPYDNLLMNRGRRNCWGRRIDDTPDLPEKYDASKRPHTPDDYPKNSGTICISAG